MRRGVTGLGRGGASVPSPPRSPCSSRPPRAPARPARRYPGTPAHTRPLRVIGPGRGARSGLASTHAKADRQLQAQALVPAWAQVRGSDSGFGLATGNDAADEARVEHGILWEGGRRRAEGGELVHVWVHVQRMRSVHAGGLRLLGEITADEANNASNTRLQWDVGAVGCCAVV